MKTPTELIRGSIQVETLETGPCHKRVHVSLPSETCEEIQRGITASAARVASLPGFRPGKAPLHMIAKAHKAKIEAEAVETIFKESVNILFADAETDVLDYNFADGSAPTLAAGRPFEYTLDLETAPQIELPNYKGIEIELPKIEIREQDVEEYVTALRVKRAKFGKVDEPAQEGDMLKVSYSSDIEVPEGANPQLARLAGSEDGYLWLTKNEFIPGVKDALLGVVVGEERFLSAEFPADHPCVEVQGRKANYKIQVVEVQRSQPMSDEDLCRQEGISSLDELRAGIRRMIESQIESSMRTLREVTVLDKLVSGLDFPLPRKMLETSLKSELERMAEKKEAAPEGETLEKTAEINAANNLRLTLLLREIAKREGVEVDKFDMANRIGAMSRMYNMKEKDLTQRLVKGGAISKIYDEIMVAKVVKLLLDNAKITYVERKAEAV